eukprot:gene34127-13179_t
MTRLCDGVLLPAAQCAQARCFFLRLKADSLRRAAL